MAWGMNRDEVQTCFVLSPAWKMILSAVLPFFPINLVSCVKTLFPFQPFSNCLCCVSPTLRCPLISSLRQDLSFSPLLTSFLKCNLTSHGFLLSFFSHPRALFFPRCSPLLFLCDSQRIKWEGRVVFSTHCKLGQFVMNAWVQKQCTSESTIWEITHTQQFFNIFHAVEDVIHETNTVFLYSHTWIRGTGVPDFQKSGCYANTVNLYATATKSCTFSMQQFKFSTVYSQLAVAYWLSYSWAACWREMIECQWTPLSSTPLCVDDHRWAHRGNFANFPSFCTNQATLEEPCV